MRTHLRLATALILLFSLQSMAEDSSAAGTVAVETNENYTLPYKERRGKHGLLFAIEMEKFYPFDYQSIKHDGSFVEDVIGTSRINLVGFEIGYKYNVSIGSVAALFTYAKGTGEGARILDIVKQGVSANVTLDALFNEPWVAPYVQVGMHQFSVAETSTTFSLTESDSFALNYRYGLLFQLNWIENSIDKSSQADALRSSGLENTFIDIYFAEHLASSGAQDPSVSGGSGQPNMASSGEMGIGLKLEF